MEFKRLSEESGVVFVIVPLVLVALCQISSFVFDIGFAQEQRRSLQVSTDAAALAGVRVLIDDPDLFEDFTTSTGGPDRMHQAASDLEVRNNLSTNVFSTTVNIEVGTWDRVDPLNPQSPRFFQPYVSGNGVTFVNAVRVTAQRTLPTSFGQLLGLANLRPAVSSLAIAGGGVADCLVPFGVREIELDGLTGGETITVNTNGQGNWGKLDVGGINTSSNPVFYNAMLNGVCGAPLEPGDGIEPGTGFAGLRNAFDDRLAANPYVVFPVVDDFGNGNSTDSIVQSFALFELLGQGNRNGYHWSGDVRFIQYIDGSFTFGTPPPGSGDPVLRSLIK